MAIPTTLEAQLLRDEGKSLTPYRDSLGFWTIGIGHFLGAVCPPWAAGGISEAKCEELFAQDIAAARNRLSFYFFAAEMLGMTPRVAALVNMSFNLGNRLRQFSTFTDLIKAGRYTDAAADLKNTLVYRQLPERYGRLATQIETGEWT